MKNIPMPSRILTSTGIRFDVLKPDPNAIHLEDIAHALSHLCRFGGHCRSFYSVAEHSTLVAKAVRVRHEDDLGLARWALLHDASEAYVVDVPRPAKRQLPQYQEMEDAIQQAVAKRFNLPWPMPEEVHRADTDLLALELRAYMPVQEDGRLPKLPADLALGGMPKEPLAPKVAKDAFLEMAQMLGVA